MNSSLAGVQMRPCSPSRAPDLLAVFATVAAVGWLLIVANPTISYLSPVLSQAVLSVVNMIAGEQTSRQLFVSKSGYVAPLLERVTGLGAVLLCLLGLPFGLYQVWRRYSRSAVAVLLALAAVGYFAMLGFRLTGAGWETANRASTYLFLGLALVLSMAAVQLWLAKVPGRIGRLVVAAYVGIVFAGGVIAGWPGAAAAGPALRGRSARPNDPAGRRGGGSVCARRTAARGYRGR